MWYMVILYGPKLIPWSAFCCYYAFAYIRNLFVFECNGKYSGWLYSDKSLYWCSVNLCSQSNKSHKHTHEIWCVICHWKFRHFCVECQLYGIATMIYTWIQFVHQNEQWISLKQRPSVFLSFGKYGSEMLQNHQQNQTYRTRMQVSCKLSMAIWASKWLGLEIIHGQDYCLSQMNSSAHKHWKSLKYICIFGTKYEQIQSNEKSTLQFCTHSTQHILTLDMALLRVRKSIWGSISWIQVVKNINFVHK